MGRTILHIFIFTLLFISSLAYSANHPAGNIKRSEQILIENRISALKHEDKPENVSRIVQLNTRLEQLTGINRTIFTPYSGGEFRFEEMPVPFESDFINNIKIFSNPGQIRGITACIEQRGPTAGKIWVCVVYSAGNTSPDTLKIFSSANNGASWNFFGSGNIRPLDKINAGDLDMEMIENVSGQKFLWIFYGYRQNGGVSPWMTGGFVLQEPSINATFFNALNWPGADSTKRYYNIRVTSDNARYASTASLYFICSFDSLNTSGVRVNSQKFARCLNPYGVSGFSFSYMGANYLRQDEAGPQGYQRTVYSDICYFNNGGADSIEVSYAGGTDSTKIYFSKGDITGSQPAGYTGSGASIGGSQGNDVKSYASLSSNGNDNGSVICTFRQYTGNNWYTKWFLTNNYGNFNNIQSESSLMGSDVNPNYAADLISVRNGNTHYIAFTTKASIDSIHYISVNSTGTFTHTPKMNYYSATEMQGPKALFRYQTGDSCLMLYSESGSLNLYTSAGCSGEPIGIINNSTSAEKFSLNQNYPNPFNPKTIINYQLAISGIVDLKVYDITGKEVITLVNGKQSGGNHEVDFNGNDLPSGVYFYQLTIYNENSAADNPTAPLRMTKKMVLVK